MLTDSVWSPGRAPGPTELRALGCGGVLIPKTPSASPRGSEATLSCHAAKKECTRESCWVGVVQGRGHEEFMAEIGC